MEPLKGTEDSNLQASPVLWLFLVKKQAGARGREVKPFSFICHTSYNLHPLLAIIV